MKVNLHPIKLTSTHKVLMDAYYGKQAKLQNRAKLPWIVWKGVEKYA